MKNRKMAVFIFLIIITSFFLLKECNKKINFFSVNKKEYNTEVGTLDGSKLGIQIVKELGNGINLGNTFDTTDSVDEINVATEVLQTGWGTKSLVWEDQNSKKLVVDNDLIDSLYNKGIRSIRIPCSWDYHVNFIEDSDGNFLVYKLSHSKGTVNKDGFLDEYDYFQKLDALISYITNKGMYVILDIHHPYTTISQSTGLRENTWQDPIEKNYDKAIKKIEAYWNYIAEYYKKYDEHVVFELFNEIRDRDVSKSQLENYNYSNAYEWSGTYGWASNSKVITEYFKILNDYNAVAVNAIRSTGANNKYRLVLLPTYANSTSEVAMKYVYSSIREATGDTSSIYSPSNVDDNNSCDKNSSFCHKEKIINKYTSLNDKYLAVAIHAYTPNSFAQDSNGDIEYSSNVRNQLSNLFQSISNELTNYNIPVLITEFGAINKDNISEREKYIKDYVEFADDYGKGLIKVFWWDSGTPFLKGKEGYSIIDRTLVKTNDHEKALNSYTSFVNDSKDIFHYQSEVYALDNRTNIIKQSVDWNFNNLLSILATVKNSDDSGVCSHKINLAFVLDDAHYSSEELISKINSYGYKAGLAVITSYADSASDGKTSNYLNWDKIKYISDNGNEILSHSVNHASNLFWSNQYGSDKMISLEDTNLEAVNSKKIIENKIGHTISGFVVPQNVLDDDHYNVLKSIYQEIYGTGTNQKIISRTQYSASSESKWDLKSVLEFKNHVENAIETGMNTVVYFHNNIEMPDADLIEILDYLKENDCVSVVKPVNLLENNSEDKPIDLSKIKVTIENSKQNLWVGDVLDLHATVSGIDSSQVYWRVNDENIVKLEEKNGKSVLTTLSSGTALITAYVKVNGVEISDTLEVIVKDDKITIESNLLKDDFTMKIGEKIQLNPKITVESGNAYDVDYQSDNSEVIRVLSGGVITANSSGCANVKILVTSKRNDFSQTEELVLPICVEKDNTPLKIDADDVSLNVLEKKKVNFTINVTENYTLNFKILDSSIASVSNDGIVIGIAKGSTKLIITLVSGEQEVSKEINVFVSENTEKISINLDKKSLSLYNGENDKLIAFVTPADYSNQIQWNSSNSNVVKIDSNGNISTLSVGEATIQAFIIKNDVKYVDECYVSVLPNPLHFSNSISYKNFKLNVGETEKVQIDGEFLNSSIDYVTSDNDILKVDDNGTVTALKKGNASITATLNGTNVFKKFDFSILKNNQEEGGKNAFSDCNPKISYSTTEYTISKVVAAINFGNTGCIVVNNNHSSTKIFESNGEFIFKYTKDNIHYGEIKAEVTWIKDLDDQEVLNPKTGTSFIYVIVGILILSASFFAFNFNRLSLKNM